MLSYGPSLEKLIPLSEILPVLGAFTTINIRNIEKKQGTSVILSIISNLNISMIL